MGTFKSSEQPRRGVSVRLFIAIQPLKICRQITVYPTGLSNVRLRTLLKRAFKFSGSWEFFGTSCPTTQEDSPMRGWAIITVHSYCNFILSEPVYLPYEEVAPRPRIRTSIHPGKITRQGVLLFGDQTWFQQANVQFSWACEWSMPHVGSWCHIPRNRYIRVRISRCMRLTCFSDVTFIFGMEEAAELSQDNVIIPGIIFFVGV
jgi:hypothetical protein